MTQTKQDYADQGNFTLVPKDYVAMTDEDIVKAAMKKKPADSKVKLKIVHDHPGCIGCAACVAMHGPNWELKDDEKAMPEKTDLEESDRDGNMRAAQNCPVNVIHLVDLKTGKKLI
ncbi:MAG TPA: ferredoxin [Candidatus Nanoarchaeia archaeon]|nr:ferredoxin [Candidatus Nanoarchaeia archaeon]